MARELVVRLIGDDESLRRSFLRSSRASSDFDRNLSRSARGAIAASVSFRGLGRALAFSSNAFLGGAGIVFAIKSTIAAAEQSQNVLAQTQVAVRRSGLSWATYASQVQKAAFQLSNLSGFDDEALLQTFSLLVRGTNDVSKALKLNALAADVARGRNISLDASARLVQKAALGQAGALRRLGIDAKNGASGVQLVGLLTQKYSGAAEAFGKTAAGSQDRFRVAVQNLQEAIGQGLLPTITKLLDPLSEWLNNSENQVRVQRDVEEAAHDLAAAFGTFKGVIDDVDKVTGSFKHTMELLIGLKVASVINGWTKALIGFEIAAGAGGAGGAAGKVTTLGKRLQELARIGVLSVGLRFPGLGDALSKLPILRSNLTKLSLVRAITVPVVVAITADFLGKKLGENTDFSPGRFIEEGLGGLNPVKNKGPLLNAILGNGFVSDKDLAERRSEVEAKARQERKQVEDFFEKARELAARKPIGSRNATAGFGGSVGGTAASRITAALTASQRNTFFDNQISRILLRGGLGNIAQQIAALQKADTLIEQRLRVTKDVTRRLNIEDELLQNQAQIKTLRGQQTADALQKQQDARQKAIDALAASAAARNARQFQELGLTASGDERTPGVAGLKKRLQQLTANVNASSLNTPKLQTELARFRKVLSEGLVGQPVRAKIKEGMDQIADLLKQSTEKVTKNLTRFRHVNANAIVGAFGGDLTADQKRRLRQVISQIGSGGTVPGGRSPSFAAAGALNVVVQAPPVYLDGKKISQNTTTHQRRQNQRRTDSRRGPYAGRH